MTRLILTTVICVVALIFIFEFTRGREADNSEGVYLDLARRILDTQPLREKWDWHVGPLPIPGTEGVRGDYIILTPQQADWGTGAEAEGRELPEPPPVPRTPAKAPVPRLEAVVVAQDNVQTEWILLRNKGLGEHELVEARAGGRSVTKKMAAISRVPGREGALHLYQCYLLGFKVYRYRQEMAVSPSSRYPMGKRLIEVGTPWVEWGEPEKVSATTCRVTFEPKTAGFKDRVPRGEFILPVTER